MNRAYLTNLSCVLALVILAPSSVAEGNYSLANMLSGARAGRSRQGRFEVRWGSAPPPGSVPPPQGFGEARRSSKSDGDAREARRPAPLRPTLLADMGLFRS